jgi:hypothetical protein
VEGEVQGRIEGAGLSVLVGVGPGVDQHAAIKLIWYSSFVFILKE